MSRKVTLLPDLISGTIVNIYRLHLYVNFLFIKPVTNGPHEQDYTNCIKKRTYSRISRNMNKHSLVQPIPRADVRGLSLIVLMVGNSNQRQRPRQECTKGKDKQGIFPKGVKEFCQPTPQSP